MHFDAEGHLIVSPREVHQLALQDRPRLINSVLLQGTPRAIQRHDRYCELLNFIADRIGVHPNNMFFKGSTKIGFSVAPKPNKVWMEYGPASDLDLAIVDDRFFHSVDYEVGRWEWRPENRPLLFRNRRMLKEFKARTHFKGKFDCFRFFDLPPIPCMERLHDDLDAAPVEACCGIRRSLRAFIFRDWWGVCKRYDFDLYCLCSGLQRSTDPFPEGGDAPRPYEESNDGTEDEEVECAD